MMQTLNIFEKAKLLGTLQKEVKNHRVFRKFTNEKTPKMYEVDSSCVQRIGYNMFRQELTIQFVGNDTKYIYENISLKLYKSFKRAESKGKFFNSKIKIYS